MQCFAAVFAGLTKEEILAASAGSKGTWDSLSAVTLAAVVQEEFGIDIAPEILPQLDSFEAYRIYLGQLRLAGE